MIFFVDPHITALIYEYSISLYEYYADEEDTNELLTTPAFSKLRVLKCNNNENFTDEGLAHLDCEIINYNNNIFDVDFFFT